MKVAILTRTYNEEVLIDFHCTAYDWADAHIIADGGSTDRTLEIAAKHSNVQIHYYNKWVTSENGQVGRNPEGDHINFLLDLGSAYDWIILEDVDGLITDSLRSYARRILSSASQYDTIFIPRMYIWGKDYWFPQLTGDSVTPGNEWYSLWAWKPTPKIRWLDTTFGVGMIDPYLKGLSRYYEHYPHMLLHYFCLNQEAVDRKLRLYRESGQSPDMVSWDKTCGPKELLPKWCQPTYYPEWDKFQTDLC